MGHVGVEPTTNGLRVCHAIQGYRRINRILSNTGPLNRLIKINQLGNGLWSILDSFISQNTTFMLRPIQIRYTHELAKASLNKGTEFSAGYDLSVCQVKQRGAGHYNDFTHYVLRPNEMIFFSTGLSIWINNPHYVGKIYPRSGLGSRGLVLGNLVGIIDADYQGEIKIPLWNRSNQPITVHAGSKVAQLIFEPVVHPAFEVVEQFHAATERGVGGFGSTGG